MRRRSVIRFWASVALSFSAVACTQVPYPEVVVDMTPPGAAPSTTGSPSGRPPLRISVATILSPQDTFSSYSRLFDLLGRRLGVPVQFVQRRTYSEVDDLLAAGKVDAALVCTGGYLDLLQRAPGAVAVLAVPVVGGRSTYHSLVIVPASANATSLSDLAGKRFAFTDELSFSGHIYPSRLLRDQGHDPAHFFASTTFTRSHDRSIDAVARGLVDGAAVDSLVYEALAVRDPSLRERTRVIHQSPPYGVMPFVASTQVSPSVRDQLREELLRLHLDPEAVPLLRDVHIDRFAVPEPGLYDAAAAVMGIAR
jgi:phosphonate transport system substrate-binding protein